MKHIHRIVKLGIQGLDQVLLTALMVLRSEVGCPEASGFQITFLELKPAARFKGLDTAKNRIGAGNIAKLKIGINCRRF